MPKNLSFDSYDYKISVLFLFKSKHRIFSELSEVKSLNRLFPFNGKSYVFMACIQVLFTPDFCFKLREDLLHYLIRPRDDTITIAAGPLFINTTFLPMSKVNASFDSRCDDDYTHQRRRPVLLFPMLPYPFSNQNAFY